MDAPGPSRLSWPLRHDRIQSQLAQTTVRAALAEASKTSKVRRALKSTKGKGRAASDTLADIDTDLALEIFWSTNRLGHRDDNLLRTKALPALRHLSAATLTTADFPAVTPLQRSAASHVEIVRARFNRQLYVLKTVVKGLARRESHRCNPCFEAQLLVRGRQVPEHRRPVPELLTSFQSQNSLHIAMQYFPAGDLDQLLHSAGQAGVLHGFGRNGGLLDESYVKAYATDIVAAVSWCHDQGFAHRDVKPANFLLDRSGHLKLCDFATAAPFSTFASLSSSPKRRRVHFMYSCLAGTPDYIAPDILLAEEERLNGLNSRSRASWSPSCLEDSSFSWAASSVSARAPDSEGFYGPEVDWWSVGVVIYEMIYKNVPFWAETIREAHYRIRNHDRYLNLDGSVQVSTTLQGFVRSLLASRDARLGTGMTGSSDVQSHPFFDGVNWDRYLEAKAPFVPTIETVQSSQAALSDLAEEEPSVVHSPRVQQGRAQPAVGSWDESYSMSPESIHLSQMFTGDPQDFPLFVDPMDPAPVSVLPVPLIKPHANSPEHSRSVVPPWSDLDVSWLGFSALPTRSAFQNEAMKLVAATPAQLPRRSSCASLLEASPASSSIAGSPQPSPFSEASIGTVGPVASTPYSRLSATATFSPSRVGLSPPAIAASTPGPMLHKTIHKASLVAKLATPSDGRFITPLRKTSMPNISSVYTSSRKSGVPAQTAASPYPFPMAATPAPAARKTSAASTSAAQLSSIRPLPLQHQQQRRSESPYSRIVSMGSDSRCSGGSNAKRDFSETEAMEQLEAAVMQSARKVRLESQERSFPQRLAALEEKVLSAGKRPSLPHSRTSPALPSAAPSRSLSGPAARDLARRRPSAPTISVNAVSSPSAPRPASTQSSLRNSEKPKGPSPVNSFASRRPLAAGRIQPKLHMPTPIIVQPDALETPAEESQLDLDSPLLSRPASRQDQWRSANSSETASCSNVAQPSSSTMLGVGSDASGAHQLKPTLPPGRLLRSRRSDRQLKLEAQERTTPTRPARVTSPLLTTQFDLAHLSLGPPTPLEERNNPVDAQASHGDCRTPDLTDNNDSDGSSSADSLKTNVSTSICDARSALDKQSFYGTFPSSHGARVAAAKPSIVGLAAPGALSAHDPASRLRSRSHSQLPKFHHLSLGVARNDPPQLAQIREQTSTVQKDSQTLPASQQAKQISPETVTAPAARGIRRKDSREMLKEYRNSARAASPFGLESFPEDAFGSDSGMMLAPRPSQGLVAPTLSARRPLRPSSALNLSQHFKAGEARAPLRPQSTVTVTPMMSAPTQRNTHKSRKAASWEGVTEGLPRPDAYRHGRAASNERRYEATDSPSPLSKMEHRFTGLQTSVFGLQHRLLKLKAKLQE